MSLQVWLPLNGSLENLGLDSFNFTQSIASGYEDGKIGKALQMKNSNVDFIVPSLIDAKEFSVAFWYKAIADDTITTNWNKVLRFQTKNADGTSGSDFRFESSYAGNYATANYALSVHNNTTQSLGSIGHEIVNSKGAWHHVCFTHTPDDNYTYLDGIQIRYGAGAAGTLTGRIIIAGASPYPNGLMNDLRVYDHAVSQKEVKELSKGLVAHYPLNDFVGNPNLVSNQNRWYLFNGNHTLEHTNDGVKMTVTTAAPNGFMIPFASDNALIGGETFTLTFKYKTNISNFSQLYLMCRSGGNKVIGLSTNYYSPNEWKTFSFTSSFPSTSGQATHAILIPYINVVNSWIEIKDNTLKLEKGSTATPWIPNAQDDLYSAMGLDESIVYDCSGYGHNGEIVGDVYSASNSPRYSSAMHLDSTDLNTYTYIEGAAAYIVCPVELIHPTAFTISLWAKIEGSYNNGGHGLVSASLVDLPTDYLVSTFNNRDNTFDINSSDGNSHIRPMLPFIFSQWTNYVLTYNGKTATTYRNGVLYNSVSFSSDTVLGSMNKIFIGLSIAGGAWRKILGDYSDVRIYCTALSADDIKALYETSASIDDKGNFHAYEISEV